MTVDARLSPAVAVRQVGVRADPAGPAARALEEVLGGPLPVEPNTVREGVLWLGPDEWLVTGRDVTEHDLRGALGDAGAAVELSANRVALEIAGRAAREVLAACCALDLHPSVFAPGTCAQTLVAGVPVILEQLDSEPRYRLLVRPSLAAHVLAWLEDAVAGLGLPPDRTG